MNLEESEETYHAYVSKNNLNCEKQVITLMIPNRENKKLSPKGNGIIFQQKNYQYYN